MTAAQQRARAHIIFKGVALDGLTATGIQRFRVIRYLKGKGPKDGPAQLLGASVFQAE